MEVWGLGKQRYFELPTPRTMEIWGAEMSPLPRSAAHTLLGRESISTHRNADVRLAATLVPLDAKGDLVEVAHVHPEVGPSVEMIRDGDGPTRALLSANTPVLVEGGGAIDGWLIDSLCSVDVIGAVVTRDGSHVSFTARWTPGAPAINDIIFYER